MPSVFTVTVQVDGYSKLMTTFLQKKEKEKTKPNQNKTKKAKTPQK